MLTSITPLGGRSRNYDYRSAVTALVFGAAIGGAMLGLLAGAVGSELIGRAGAGADPRVVALAGFVGGGVIAQVAGIRAFPPRNRQVNEDWIGRYRGWLIGLGFGLQLGAGLATIVTAWSVYATFVAAFLSGSAPAGAVIGLAVGAIRGLAALPSAWVHTPGDLLRLGRVLAQLTAPVRRVGIGLEAAVAATIVMTTVL